ncbi:MAG: flavin reductase family protein [Desulfarculus sp.]|nr:flavin reductase family protein [Desulfarculus sp.]
MPSPNPIDDPIRQVLGRLSYGLYFLTVGSPAAPQGLLVSWVSQVSGEPPLILVAVRHNRSLAPALVPGAGLALNLLPAVDRALLASLARPADQRFSGVELITGPLGLPVLAGGLGAVVCRVREVSQPGDHRLCLGEVVGAAGQRPGQTLSAAVSGHPYLGLS